MDGRSVIASKNWQLVRSTTDRFVSIQRRNRTRSYRFDDQLDGRSMVASKGLATRAFDNTDPFGKHPASELHGRLLRGRLAFAMIHRKMRLKLAGGRCRPNQTEQSRALEHANSAELNGTPLARAQ